MTTRPTRYAVDRSVDPERSPPSYQSPLQDQTDSPYHVDNHVQSRNSTSGTEHTVAQQVYL
jgi:hypothetical protein